MGVNSVAAAAEQARLLVQDGQFEAAWVHLDWGLRHLGSREDGLALRGAVGQLPPLIWGEVRWAKLLGMVGYRSGDLELIGRALAAMPAGEGHGLRAYGLLQAGQWQEARRVAADVLSTDAVARRVWARTSWELREDWRQAYDIVLPLESGRDRALLRVDYAVSLVDSNDDASARTEYAQAIRDFGRDHWGRISALGNRGVACLNLGEFAAAEGAFLEGLQTSSRVGVPDHLPLLWRGLGTVWRAHGEYRRAIAAYRKALPAAGAAWGVDQLQDVFLARRAEAYAWGLLGQIDTALDTIFALQSELEGGTDLLRRTWIDVALWRLKSGDARGAALALADAPLVSEQEKATGAVIRAELARRSGDMGAALGLLHTAQLRPVWRMELSLVFPDLFGLLGPLPTPPNWVVDIEARGPITVRMHRQKLELPPQSDAAALLVLLCMNAHSLARERVVETLFPQATTAQRRQRLDRAVRQLRERLGWPEALRSDGQFVTLSSDPHWQLSLPTPAQADLFCEGRRDEWILQWRQEHSWFPVDSQ